MHVSTCALPDQQKQSPKFLSFTILCLIVSSLSSNLMYEELSMDETSQEKLKDTADELVAERAMAMRCLVSG